MFELILLRVSDDQVAVEDLCVERRIARGQAAVGQAHDLLELVVEDVDRAMPEIGGIQQGGPVVCADRQSLVTAPMPSSGGTVSSPCAGLAELSTSRVEVCPTARSPVVRQ